MENHNENNRLAAIEAVLAEVAEQLKRSQTAAEQRSAEFALELRKSQEAAKQRSAEFEKELKESEAAAKQRSAEFAQKLNESQETFDRKNDALTKQLKEVGQQIGGISKSNGLFAEEYFFNSFNQGKQSFFGEKFDAIKKNLKGTVTDDEFDVVMLNGHTVGIVEVKYRARENDINKVLRKAVTFRENFPYYVNHRVYLGYATLSFDDNIEQVCIENGIAVIKQVGETVVIYDEHLRVF